MAPTADIHARGRELSGLWLDHADRFRVRARQTAAEVLGPVDDLERASWFELVAGEFLSVMQEQVPVVTLLSQVVWAADLVAERAPPGDDLAFSGDTPEPYWSGWPTRGQPPPLVRDHRPVRCAAQPDWEHSSYDTAAWTAMYQLLIRMTHIGDFASMELYPVPDIEPPILADDQATIVFDHGTREYRPPMGLAVATMLLRQQAFEYASDFDQYQIAGWLFSTMTSVRPTHDTLAPDWADEAIRQGLPALAPRAMLAASRAAARDLDILYGAS